MISGMLAPSSIHPKSQKKFIRGFVNCAHAQQLRGAHLRNAKPMRTCTMGHRSTQIIPTCVYNVWAASHHMPRDHVRKVSIVPVYLAQWRGGTPSTEQ